MLWLSWVGKDLASFQNGRAVLALKKGRFALCDEPKTFSRFALWTSPWRCAEVFNFPKAQSSPELFRIMVRFIHYVTLRVSFKKFLASGMIARARFSYSSEM
jgi:hypothetical protein